MKQKTEFLSEKKSKSAQTSVHNILSIQMQKLRQENLLSVILKLSILTGIGILGRAALQGIPSVEPIIPLAIAIGFFYGHKYSMTSGMSAFYLSNFVVWGGQGPWTIFQVAGTGLAAATGSFFGKISKSKYSFISAAIIGTIFYEIAVNLGWGFMMSALFSFELMFLLALPFTIIHIASSIGFCLMLYGFKDKLSEFIKGDIYELKVFAGRNLGFGSGDNSGKPAKPVNRLLCFKRGRNKRSCEYKEWHK
jgi:hypothetical protein